MIVVFFKVFHDQQRKSGPLLLQTSRPNYWPKYWPCCPSSASSSSSGRTTTATCRISFAPSQTRAATTSCQRKLILLDCICGRQRPSWASSASTSTNATWPSSTRRWKCSPCAACHENQNCIAHPRIQLAGHYHGPFVNPTVQISAGRDGESWEERDQGTDLLQHEPAPAGGRGLSGLPPKSRPSPRRQL